MTIKTYYLYLQKFNSSPNVLSLKIPFPFTMIFSIHVNIIIHKLVFNCFCTLVKQMKKSKFKTKEKIKSLNNKNAFTSLLELSFL